MVKKQRKPKILRPHKQGKLTWAKARKAVLAVKKQRETPVKEKQKRVLTLDELKTGMVVSYKHPRYKWVDDTTKLKRIGQAESVKFFIERKEDNWVTWMDTNCAYEGMMTSQWDSNIEYTVLYERGTKEYNEYVNDIRKERLDCERDAHNDIMLLEAYWRS